MLWCHAQSGPVSRSQHLCPNARVPKCAVPQVGARRLSMETADPGEVRAVPWSRGVLRFRTTFGPRFSFANQAPLLGLTHTRNSEGVVSLESARVLMGTLSASGLWRIYSAESRDRLSTWTPWETQALEILGETRPPVPDSRLTVCPESHLLLERSCAPHGPGVDRRRIAAPARGRLPEKPSRL
jgi:hypothetical protein